MPQLSQVADEAVRLWMPQGHNVVLVESFDSTLPVRSVQPSTFSGTLPMHASAAGKAILALLPAGEVDALLTPPPRGPTPATITDPDQLPEPFPLIPQKGYAQAPNQTAPHARATT